MDFAYALRQVREKAPLVQCITNFVTANDCANILLAAGGSPTMAYDIREVEETVAAAQALVCNMGAIDQAAAMTAAGKKANELGRPVVLDPIAAGATVLRREVIGTLIGAVRFAAVRGNASEIRGLAIGHSAGSGVDVGALDAVGEDNWPQAAEMAKELSVRTGAVIVISGPIDVIADADRTLILRNGCATMARITGSGCMSTALMGAFCGAMPDAPFEAACGAMAVMGVCGEIAETRRLRTGTGNATFRTDLIDGVFNLTEKQLMEGVRYEIY